MKKQTKASFTKSVRLSSFSASTPLVTIQNKEEGLKLRGPVELQFNTPSPRCLRTRPLPQGVRKTARGFTLIELLVIVLIISILAAVALPQYQAVVAKSRLAAIKPILQAAKKLHEVNYLETGSYSNKSIQNILDISNTCKTYQPGSGIYDCGHGFLINFYHDELKAIRVFYCPGSEQNYSKCWSNANDFRYTLYLQHSSYLNKIGCYGITHLGQKVCNTEVLN